MASLSGEVGEERQDGEWDPMVKLDGLEQNYVRYPYVCKKFAQSVFELPRRMR